MMRNIVRIYYCYTESEFNFFLFQDFQECKRVLVERGKGPANILSCFLTFLQNIQLCFNYLEFFCFDQGNCTSRELPQPDRKFLNFVTHLLRMEQ